MNHNYHNKEGKKNGVCNFIIVKLRPKHGFVFKTVQRESDRFVNSFGVTNLDSPVTLAKIKSRQSFPAG